VSPRYAAGGDDDVLEEVLQSLRGLLAECRRRADKIKRLPKDLRPENKVTPQLANRRGLHPLVVAIDECQELFGNKQFGAEAGELDERIIKLGRAFGVILLLATQRPDKDSLPTGITANVGTRLALRVTDQTTNLSRVRLASRFRDEC
jgi:DNA segregation ATPase FtsK/SpoIIIE, S-DNA-T family